MKKSLNRDCDTSDVCPSTCSFVNRLPVLLIRLYQKTLSPVIAAHCIFHPSCSQYAVDAYHKYGFLKATFKMIWRIMRCNPLSKGGNDPA